MKKNKLLLLSKALYELNLRKRQNPLEFFKPIDNIYLNQKAFVESKKKILLFSVVIGVEKQ